MSFKIIELEEILVSFFVLSTKHKHSRLLVLMQKTNNNKLIFESSAFPKRLRN